MKRDLLFSIVFIYLSIFLHDYLTLSAQLSSYVAMLYAGLHFGSYLAEKYIA